MDSLLALVIGFAVGGVFYYFDFKQGLGPYRSWYKLTHKDPLPKEIERGFVYQQNFSGKLYTGIILTLLVTLIIILTGSQNMLVQLLFGAFILVGMMLSFYLAPLIFRHGPAQLNKIQKAVEKIDQFEKEIRPPEKKPEPVEAKKEVDEEEPKKEEKKPENKDDKDWRSGIKDYLND